MSTQKPGRPCPRPHATGRARMIRAWKPTAPLLPWQSRQSPLAPWPRPSPYGHAPASAPRRKGDGQDPAPRALPAPGGACAGRRRGGVWATWGGLDAAWVAEWHGHARRGRGLGTAAAQNRPVPAAGAPALHMGGMGDPSQSEHAQISFQRSSSRPCNLDSVADGRAGRRHAGTLALLHAMWQPGGDAAPFSTRGAPASVQGK